MNRTKLNHAFSIEDLRRAARRRLPRGVFDFIDGGAEEESTLKRNAAAYEERLLLPRVLLDVSVVDPSTPLLGAMSALPLAVGPTGGVGYVWRHGDIAIARAAAAAGIPYTLSSAAHTSIEEVAAKAPGRHWFQCYMLRNAAFNERLIERALAADYEALMVTVDLPVGGNRERDARNRYAVPFTYTLKNLLDFASRPAWSLEMLLNGQPLMGSMVGLEAEAGDDAMKVASSVGRNIDASFDWKRLQAIRDRWPRKLLVKGVCHPEDAERLAAMGVDCIVVSNHGGRQLDGAVATLDALPRVVAAVGDRVPVMVDGGIRRGTHVVKALALGARGVLIGRPTVWGAAAGGEAGAAKALAILSEELRRTMQLCGTRTIGEINRSLLAY